MKITVAAMVTVVFSNLVSYQIYGRSLYDTQLAGRGVDLCQGREKAYLEHQKAVNFAMQTDFAIDDAEFIFDENTSLWQAMELTREHSDARVNVMHSGSGEYLGQLTQISIVNAYLDAIEELRREEHEV